MGSEDAKIITHFITTLLARREHSRIELIQKLKEKGFSEHLSLEVLDKFIEKNIQSDARFAEVYVRSAYQKGKGPYHIQQKLLSHEIDHCVIKENITNDAYDWFELASKVRQKRFGEKLPIDFKEIQKQKRFLQYRGFEQQHIEYAAKNDFNI